MREKFQHLLDRYHKGDCTIEEVEELLAYLEEDPSLYHLLDQHVNREWSLRMFRSDSETGHKTTVIKQSRFSSRWIWSAAAALIILVAVGIGLTQWKDQSGTILYSTNFGERKEIELPDGSKVEMNANTRLTWDEGWQKSGIRQVKLEGEAFFEVVKSEAKQFKVMSEDMSVNVLGTSFNISNRRGKTEVFLEKGRVSLELAELDGWIEMEPGEMVWYDRNAEESIQKRVDETLYSAVAWKMGVIKYQKTPLEKILPELNDIYGIEIICENAALCEKVMDIGVPYMDWEATKHSLELAMKVSIEESNGIYLIKDNMK